MNETLYCILGIPHAQLGAYALPTIMLRYEHSWSLPVFKCLPHILLHRQMVMKVVLIIMIHNALMVLMIIHHKRVATIVEYYKSLYI